MSSYRAGQVVGLNDGRQATVRFVGETSFAQGDWIGVEFEDALGKNDGSVQGERYFDCQPGHGMFMRPSGISAILEEPRSKPQAAKSATKENGKPSGSVVKGRPSSITTSTTRPRQSMAPPATTKRQSMAPSTTTARRTPVPPNPSTRLSARSSIGPGLRSTSSRPSLSGTTSARSGVSSPTKPSGVVSPTKPTPLPSAASRRVSPPTSGAKSISSTLQPSQPPQPTASSRPSASKPSPASNKEIDDLNSKIRILEKKRLEDREKLKTFDRTQEERDRFHTIIEKLQAKCQTQQHESTELRKQLRDTKGAVEQIEAMQAEHDSLMEMAALDREMAEEQAEAYKTEMGGLKDRAEELQLENEILKEENEELSKDMSPEERTSKGWLQMERENGRLREALLRLRDISQEQEGQFREEIQSLEEDVQELAALKAEFDDMKAKLLESEADVDDLRQQLDAALGAEDMIEQLTERNFALTEQLEELKNMVDDLQSLTELNDELELNHVENEKQLQEVIDFKDSLLYEQTKRANQQDETLTDQEYTITRFRELVINLQADLEQMRASKEITETEAQELSSKSRDMMDLNRQLQMSASNARIKTIDLELRRMEAQEASEHLTIVQLFLPDAFHAERDSVLAYMRVKRIGFKGKLLHNFLRDKVAAQDRTYLPEQVYHACDAMDKLTWVQAMCDRFVSCMQTCDLEQFAKFAGSLYELEPVERTLNAYIDQLRKDEVKESDVVEGLHRSIALMSHLAEHHLREGLESFGDEILMKALMMQSNLESAAASLLATKTDVGSHFAEAVETGHEGLETFDQATETLIAQSRSAKVVVSKVVRALQDLKARSLSLKPDSTELLFSKSESATSAISKYAQQLGHSASSLLHVEGRTEPLHFSDVASLMRKTAASFYALSTESASDNPLQPIISNLRTLVDSLSTLSPLATDLSQADEFERPSPPWVLRSNELAATKLTSAATEAELRRLKDELHERTAHLRFKEKELEDATHKAETLDSRMKEAGKKATRITELEKLLDQGKQREQLAVRALEQKEAEIRTAVEAREHWRHLAETSAPKPGAAGTAIELTPGAIQELERLRAEVDVLQATNRFLRAEARRAKTEAQVAETSWLAAPIVAARTPEQTATESAHRKGLQLLETIAGIPAEAALVRLRPAVEGKRMKWRPKREIPRFQVLEQEMRRLEVWEMWEREVAVGTKAMKFGGGFEVPSARVSVV
ncbi:hypothetical protein P152DRAFT_443203 [Eremomyces bilateralis CBS 781.70]|uniref:CAP-Gly domain-containing protein n=1 Tax=Eremomyces bilateralis CBS 781.70 TaxID=1392243 RepID=A0A6G1FSY8_9PEZI|nr:uncharacterized protein P152DRAFT_443203 [Eremomyces bilateralis CBS 781.70]KAF1808791.1 hypothetical protein P152DRAFT_443203 [Eremomyces bilateralis CBS 781.70]